MPTGFCRDCLAGFSGPVPSRCPACRSPRMVAHAELNQLAIAHVDCDAFYASIEKRDDPSLRDQPLIVGGSRRGVVLTCCYIARTYGVHSAMPMFKALRLCPKAAVVRPNMSKYRDVARGIRRLMGDLTPLVQPVSIDEAFLDLSGTKAVHGAVPAITLARFAARIEDEFGITVSIGLSDCKFLAKVASDMNKPRGFTLIGRAEAAQVLRQRPVGAIWGVGAVTQARLAEFGFTTIGDIQDCSQAEFARRIGRDGSRLWSLAHGIDSRPVTPFREAKSISAETTFGQDLAAADDLLAVLYQLCERVAQRLAEAGLACGGVTLKLKTQSFRTKTRARTLAAPTQLASRLFAAARGLLFAELDGTKYRLIGLAASDLRPAAEADRHDLLDATLPREKAAAAATAAIRTKFGDSAVVRGITLSGRPRRT